MSNAERDRVFVLDTNILIEMDRWMPFKLCPEFWKHLEQALHGGKWVLLDVVVKEVTYPQELVDWCKKQKDVGYVTKIGDDHKQRGADINSRHPMIDQASGKSESDTYIIAYAEMTGKVVFSREGGKKQNEALFKIPDVCKLLNVPSIREPLEFYEKIGFSSAIFRRAA